MGSASAMTQEFQGLHGNTPPTALRCGTLVVAAQKELYPRDFRKSLDHSTQ
jgi:hypothetical protein